MQRSRILNSTIATTGDITSNTEQAPSDEEPFANAVKFFDDERLYFNDDKSLDAPIGARSTRARQRCEGSGPEFLRLGDGPGARIAYPGNALNRWLAERLASSTSQADAKPHARRWASRRRKKIAQATANKSKVD